MPTPGAFNIANDPLKPRVIIYTPVNGVPPPLEQLRLQGELEAVRGELDRIHPATNDRLNTRFMELREQLEAIANIGLSGPNAKPEVASQMLGWLREITLLGPFNVASEEKERGIRFETNGRVVATEEQLTLKTKVEQAHAQLCELYAKTDPARDALYQTAHRALVGLARVGLAGAHPQPDVAERALLSWKAEILLREGGRVKNSYMRSLGRAAIGGALIAAIVWLLAIVIFEHHKGSLTAMPRPNDVMVWAQFALLWIGCMPGVWVSFGVRKTALRFEDLTKLEEDLVQPSLRLVFAGLLTLLLGAFFYKGVVSVTLGSMSTADFTRNDPLVALLLGGVCGFSELLLATKVAKQAELLLNFR